MTPETLTTIGSILISLAASYLPGFSPWFDQQDSNIKRLIMLAAIIVTGGAIFGLSCQPWLPLLENPAACSGRSLAEILRAIGLALVANQTTYALSPRSNK